MSKFTLTSKQKEEILNALDAQFGGTFSKEVCNLIAPNSMEETKNFQTSVQELLYWQEKGINAVENGILTFAQLMNEEPLNICENNIDFIFRTNCRFRSRWN